MTQAINHGCWNFLLSAGVRYAYVEQRYNARIPGVAETDTVGGVLADRDIRTGTEESRNQFTGAGPTVAIDVLWRLGDTSLSLYGNVRGSLLYGRGHLRSSFNQVDHDENFDGAGNVIATTDVINRGSSTTGGYDLLPILEIEAGLQWARSAGNYELFVRPSVVSQTYFDGGSATSRTGDFGLFGFGLATGIRF